MFFDFPAETYSGDSEETMGLSWRLRSDRDLVVYDRVCLPLCELMRKLTVDDGLVGMDLEFHAVTAKMHPGTVACLKAFRFLTEVRFSKS